MVIKIFSNAQLITKSTFKQQLNDISWVSNCLINISPNTTFNQFVQNYLRFNLSPSFTNMFGLLTSFNKKYTSLIMKLTQMRKQVILIMEGNMYPFGQAENPTNNQSKIDARILVRKKHETRSLQQRNQLLDRIHIVKSIKSNYIMKIETVLEQENSIHTLYEYVPNGLVKNINNISDFEIQKIKDQMLDLATCLAEVGLKVEWDLKNVGINDKMEGKYYLDLERVIIDLAVGRSNLQRQHFQQIIQLFSQFINEKKKANNLNLNSIIKTKVDKNEGINIKNARPANSIQSNVNLINYKIPDFPQQKQKIFETNFQKAKPLQKIDLKEDKTKPPLKKSRTNWKEIDHNQEFMQDFINVLDDKSENAQSKYVSDEELESNEKQEDERDNQFVDSYPNYDEQEQDDQEIVWVSAPEDGHEYKDFIRKNETVQEQQIVWSDNPQFHELQTRAQEAIKRSTNALAIFKNIFTKPK